MDVVRRAAGAARDVASCVTVEPVLFLFMVGSYMEYTAFQSLVYAKVCQLSYSQFVCDNLNAPEYKSQLDEVQDQSSYWMLYSNVALALPSVLSAIYIGTWSDLFGRKVPLLLPPLGQILSALVFMMTSAYQSAPVGLVVLANGVAGLLGGFTCMILGVMSYLASVTATGQRTARVGMLESMSFLGGFVGPFIGSAVFERAGRTWTFCALVMVNAAIVVYVVLVVRDVPPPKRPPRAGACCQKLAQLFSLRYLVDAVLTALKSRSGHRRAYILALFAASFVIMLNTSGENDVTYLYIKDAPLQLDDRLYNYYYSFKYSVGSVALLREMDVTYLFVKDAPLSLEDSEYFAYFAFRYASSSAALLVGMPLLRRFFDLSDTALCGLGLVSKVLGLIWLGFAVNEAMLFIAPLVMILNTFCIPPIRSMLSKLVESDEQGRIFSLLTVIESLCTLFGSLVYNSVYPATRRGLHGAVFLLGAATLLVPAVLLVGLRSHLRRGGQLHQLATAAPSPHGEEEEEQEEPAPSSEPSEVQRAKQAPDRVSESGESR